MRQALATHIVLDPALPRTTVRRPVPSGRNEHYDHGEQWRWRMCFWEDDTRRQVFGSETQSWRRRYCTRRAEL